MTILLNAKKQLMILGLIPMPDAFYPKKWQNYRSLINATHIFLLICCVLAYLASVLCYLLFEAQTFGEFSESGLFFSVTILRVVVYFIALMKKSDLPALFMDLETIIAKSELNKDDSKKTNHCHMT